MEIEKVDIKRQTQIERGKSHRIEVTDPEPSVEGETVHIGVEEREFDDPKPGSYTTTVFTDDGPLPFVVDGLGDTWEDDGQTHCYLYVDIDYDSIDPVELEESGLLQDLPRKVTMYLVDDLKKNLDL